MRIPLRSTKAAYGRCDVVDMTDENKEAQQETKEAHDGGMVKKLKRGSSIVSHSMESGAVWRLKYR